jgi:DNA-binding NtrC family response regulator
VAKAFLRNYGVEHAKPGLTFAPDALRALGLHHWPGNVRDLQNRVRRTVIMADGKRVTSRDLELTDTLSALPPETLKEARESVEREMVQDALRRHRGNHFRHAGTWHQPADALRINGKARTRQGFVMDAQAPCLTPRFLSNRLTTAIRPDHHQ